MNEPWKSCAVDRFLISGGSRSPRCSRSNTAGIAHSTSSVLKSCRRSSFGEPRRTAATATDTHSDFRESCPMHKKRSRFLPSPVRVRQEPPTVAEAVAAAQALTPVLEQQVDITAGLMGLSPDETRPFVLEAPPPTLQRSAALGSAPVITHPLAGTCFWCKISRLRQ